MAEAYPIFLREERCGTMTVAAEGLYARIEAHCDLQADYLYRLYAAGETGTLLLGVLEPRDTLLCLARRIPVAQLRTVGKLRGGQAVVCRALAEKEEAWQAVGRDGFFRARELAAQAAAVPGALWQAEGERRELAVPFTAGQRFWLEELFCFAQIRQIRGASYAVFTVDGEDMPIL